LIRTGCAWALIGAAAIFASHPACFFLAGAWGVAAVLAYRNSNRRTADRSTFLPRAKLILGAVAALWGALVLTNYLVFLRPLTHINALQVDWASAFAPHDWQFFPWLAETCDSLFASYASLWIRPAFIPEVLAVFGLAVLWRRRPWQGALLVSPLLLALVACLLGKYPLSGRLALFTLPTLILLIAAGWDAAAAQSKWIGIALAVCVAAAPVGRSIFFSIRPEREEIRPLLAYLGTHRQAGDVLYCQRLSDIPLRYYTDRFGAGDDAYGLASMPKIVGQDDYTEADAMADLAPLKRVHGGVWLLITHPAALGGLDERVIFPKILGRWGRQIIRVEATNTALFRFEMQGG
jgi:hypothetical protein